MEKNELHEFFQSLDRSFFIGNEHKSFAGEDRPLPIGFEQTISQPSLVYEMTRSLDLDKSLKVLEVGTGSGYQTAFLAQLSGEVYTIERIKELSNQAEERLARLGYRNVKFKVGDGSEGWKEYSPFDRIIVTAAAGEVPQPLIDQLNKRGKMLIPAGKRGMQELLLINKAEDGSVQREFLEHVTFVELKGKYGWNK